MMDSRAEAPIADRPSARLLPVLVVLFAASGAAALIYEIVWFQLLELFIGSSAVSLGLLLGIFMGGMCAGSIALARFVSPRRHPLRVYAALELGVAALGVIVLFMLPWTGRAYAAAGGHGASGIFLRGLVSALCLLPPTMLMGATLPAVARWAGATPRGISWLGFLYGANTAGAVLGCVLAGFYLLRVLDMPRATYFAVAINIAAALTALVAARAAPYVAAAHSDRGPADAAARPWPVYLTSALSGMSALGAEVVWTRLLTLVLGGTTYTLSIILAVFLVGIGAGSWIGSYVARGVVQPRRALGIAQSLLIGAIAWTAWSIARALPYWPMNPSLSKDPWVLFQVDVVRALWAVLPAALLWGASFPLALAALRSENVDPARTVGRVYAANTIGAIAGALAFAMIVIPRFGTLEAERVLIALAAAGALLMFLSRDSGAGSPAWAAATAALAVGLAAAVPQIPPQLVAYGRFMATRLDNGGEIIYVGEGMSSSMAVSRLSNGVLNYHNAGKIQASSEPQDMRLQRMLGHLTTLVPAKPRSILVIGCGAGVTAGAVSINPDVQRVTIAEIEPLVPLVVSTYFSRENYDVIRNPKVHLELDDGRHYVLTTSDTFDAVTSDPFDPWVKGAATLYTEEFFRAVRARLNPGGVVTVFVQLYESSVRAVKSELATFFKVFPNGIVLGNTYEGGGYDLVLLGQRDATRLDLEEIERRLRRPDYASVAASLREIGFRSAVDLFSTFAAQAPDLAAWLRDAEVNRDRNLRLQYLAGLGLNEYRENVIYQGILAHRRFPDDLFTGSPETLQSLRLAIAAAQ
jgi:spermidine synthase